MQVRVQIDLKFWLQANIGINEHLIFYFLGPQGPLVLPSVDPSRPSVPPVPAKNLDHLYTGICLTNHEKAHQTNPMAPWDPLDALLTPCDPLPPHIGPTLAPEAMLFESPCRAHS